MESIPVITTSLTFEFFFHPARFTKLDSSTLVGQRSDVQIRLLPGGNWWVFIEDRKISLFSISLISDKTWEKSWKKYIKNEKLCDEFIAYMSAARQNGEFKFQATCSKCEGKKIITKDTVSSALYNGFKVNIHQKQEYDCSCKS